MFTATAYLSVGDDAHDLGVLLDAGKLGVDLLRCLGELLRVPGERLLLGRVPVLVEPFFKHARRPWGETNQMGGRGETGRTSQMGRI